MIQRELLEKDAYSEEDFIKTISKHYYDFQILVMWI